MDQGYQINKQYYECEAKEVKVFGSVREIALNEQISSCIKKRPESVVDIGCGDGALLFDLDKKWKPRIFAFDLTRGRLNNTLNNIKHAHAIQGNVTSLPFKDNSLDMVICSEVLEHIPDYARAVDELIRITKSTLIITVPNEQVLEKIICPYCHRHFYSAGHINSFSETGMRKMLAAYNTVVVKKIKKFHTIYTYNRQTLKLWSPLRILLDFLVTRMHGIFSFLKPNFMLVVLEKI